jgi:hypothetical protein
LGFARIKTITYVTDSIPAEARWAPGLLVVLVYVRIYIYIFSRCRRVYSADVVVPSQLIHRGFWEETTLERESHGKGPGGHGAEREGIK